ncbi:hypothetical protein [Balneola vulgaris]|uniref:hypothetical protein n=1 Tax=Balneola vulgaris TaxID=287535 RepID=UPI00037EDE07|nr:hypothetical protein [Balneola vulgaris]
MKSNIKLLALFAVALSITFASCKDSSTGGDEGNEIPELYASLPGTVIANDTTWAADMTLTGQYYVLPGVTLTIEPGVTVSFTYHNNNIDDVGAIITLPADESNFETPRASGRLVAEGTASNPIVFTSARAEKQPGDWGGIVLAGEGINNIEGGRGEVEGLPDAIQYGGSNNADDSGILKYVRIEYVGFSFVEGSELNGLSLYSVGSGTTLEYIQVYKCTDDGFEWFGGSVNAKYLISAFNDDDSFDMDEGWNGKGQYWLAVQTAGADNGFESDGRKTLGSGNATSPTLYNVTLVGLTQDGSTKDAEDKNYGMRLREEFEGELENFIITDFESLSFKIEDDTRAAFPTALSIDNTIVWNNGGFANSADSTDFGAVTMEQDPGFTSASTFDFSVANPVTGATPPSDGFFNTSATHVGAFGSTNWATGAWVRWNDN